MRFHKGYPPNLPPRLHSHPVCIQVVAWSVQLNYCQTVRISLVCLQNLYCIVGSG